MNLQKLKELREKLRREIFGFAQVKTDKAILVYDTEKLEAGVAVFVEDEEGNRTPAENGEYRLEDTSTIKVDDGKVTEVVEPTPDPQKMNEDPKPEYITREEYNTLLEEVHGVLQFMQQTATKFTENHSSIDERLSTVEKMSAALTPKEDLENKTERKPASASVERELEAAKRLFGKE